MAKKVQTFVFNFQYFFRFNKKSRFFVSQNAIRWINWTDVLNNPFLIKKIGFFFICKILLTNCDFRFFCRFKRNGNVGLLSTIFWYEKAPLGGSNGAPVTDRAQNWTKCFYTKLNGFSVIFFTIYGTAYIRWFSVIH